MQVLAGHATGPHAQRRITADVVEIDDIIREVRQAVFALTAGADPNA